MAKYLASKHVSDLWHCEKTLELISTPLCTSGGLFPRQILIKTRENDDFLDCEEPGEL